MSAAETAVTVERCPGSRSYAGLFAKGPYARCRTCRADVEVVQHDDAGGGGWLAIHDRAATR